jgi:hypothetical protein
VNTDQRYNLQILLPGATALPGAATICPIDATTVEQVGTQLSASGLSPADLRSRSLLVVGTDAPTACALYATLIGLSGRFLDVSDGQRVVAAEQVAQAAAAWSNTGRLGEPVPEAQIGHQHPTLPSVGVGAALSPAEVSIVSYARRLRFVPPPDPLVALTQLIAIAAVRRRGLDQRLPVLTAGEEPADLAAGIELETLRQAGQDLRRRLDLPERSALVDAVAPTVRQERLTATAGADLAATLLRLGARQNESTGLWHCPRPERHTNGDANASMKLTGSGLRCFRCDAERIDALRLVIDTLGCTPDEAADWLDSGADRPAVRA